MHVYLDPAEAIAEFGAGNRVLDMIVYRKGGQEFLLTTNNSRGVMKIPTNTTTSRICSRATPARRS